MYYKAVINGVCQGQDIRNILYYRDGFGVSWLNGIFGGSQELANCILSKIVNPMRDVMPTDWNVQSIDVYPHNDLFQLTVQMPFSLPVNASGHVGAVHAGLSQVMNLKFQLEPGTMMNGVFPPRRGYIAVGPIAASWITPNGTLTAEPTARGQIEALCEALAGDLPFLLPTPGSFFPIRVRQNRTLGGLVKWSSWADVSGCIPSDKCSFRRSRMAEL